MDDASLIPKPKRAKTASGPFLPPFLVAGDALVVLVGAAGTGKTTFAHTHFRKSEILSSDFFRGMVSDDEGDQDASADAFALLNLALEMRLRRGKLSVVDATHVLEEHRRGLVEKARRYGRTALAVVFETPEALAVERAEGRAERAVSGDVVRRQMAELGLQSDLLQEGFAGVFRVFPGDKVQVIRT